MLRRLRASAALKIDGLTHACALPDIDQDDAILVSYSQSNAEKFAHLRPNYQRSDRASSEETDTDRGSSLDHENRGSILDHQKLEISKTNENAHIHVIHINDNDDKQNNCTQ